MKTTQLPKDSLAFVFVVFVVTGLLIYSTVLHAPFVYDDSFLRDTPSLHIEELSGLGEIITAPGVPRKVGRVSFALNYYLGGLDPGGYHFVNIVIHILSGVVLFMLSFRILALLRPEETVPRRLFMIAFVAALIWFVHPVQTQAVSYVYQRFASLCGLFMLSSLLCFVEARTRQVPKSLGLYFLTGAFAILALGTKENAAMLPLLIVLVEFLLFSRGTPRSIFIGLMAGTFILIAAAMLGADFVEMIRNDYERRGFTLSERLLTESRVVVYYVTLLLFPHPSRLMLDYDVELSTGVLSPPTTFLSLVAIVFVAGVAVVHLRTNKLVSLSVLWFLGNLVIESTFIPLDLVYEHRLYVPSMMPILLMVTLVSDWARQRLWGRLAIGFSCIVVLVFSLWTYQRNRVWADPLILWTDNVEKAPNNARAHANLANVYMELGEYDFARAEFERAIDLDPETIGAYNNLATIYIQHERHDLADAILMRAVELDPDSLPLQMTLGLLRLREGKTKEAAIRFEKVVEEEPTNPIALSNLGTAYLTLGEHQKARQVLEKAVAIWPRQLKLHLLLGAAHFEAESYALSKRAFLQALELDPGNAAAASFLVRMEESPAARARVNVDAEPPPLRSATPVDFGYYRTDRVPHEGESHIARVREWTNLVYLDWYTDARTYDDEPGDDMVRGLQNMDGMMRRAAAADMVIVMDLSFGLAWGPLLTSGEILETAAPYWSHVKYIVLGDELELDLEHANDALSVFRTAMKRMGMSERPIGATFTPEYVLEDPRVLQASWDYIAIEAYTPDCRCEDCGTLGARREIDIVAELIRAQESIIPSDVDLMMIMQGYDRNGFFVDIDALAALNRATYFDMVKGNPRYKAIAIFNWDRPGSECPSRPHPQYGHGTSGLPALQTVHQAIWRDLTSGR